MTILDANGNPIAPQKPELTVVQGDDRPDPYFSLETRTGQGHYFCLTYKEHRFEEPLPDTFMAWDEMSQGFHLDPVKLRLAKKMAPILKAEDEA